MCRLFAYSGDLGTTDFSESVRQFSKLAQNGCVPCSITPGHLDGWGTCTSTQEKEVYSRSVQPPVSDEIYTSLDSFSGLGQSIIHLRKATVGSDIIPNTHPFMRSGIAFCHNGSIKTFPNSAFENDRHLREGHTDSETFFLRVLDRVQEQVGDVTLEHLKKALSEEVEEIKQTSTWTSLTCLLKTKDGIVLNYLWNEAHEEAEKLEYDKYYTFFVGKKGSVTILCSEILNIDGFVWEKLPNGTVLSLSL